MLPDWNCISFLIDTPCKEIFNGDIQKEANFSQTFKIDDFLTTLNFSNMTNGDVHFLCEHLLGHVLGLPRGLNVLPKRFIVDEKFSS